jgi:hypothetical protein
MASEVKKPPAARSFASAEAELQARFRYARRQRRIKQGMKRIILQDLGKQLAEIVEDQLDQIVAVLNAGGLVNVNVALLVPDTGGGGEEEPSSSPDEEPPPSSKLQLIK